MRPSGPKGSIQKLDLKMLYRFLLLAILLCLAPQAFTKRRAPRKSCLDPASKDDGCPSSNLCPEKCRCGEGIVDCRDRGLTEVPLHLPEDAVELRLEQNRITSVPKRAFAPFKKLRRIDLSNNQITSIAGDAFQGLKLLNSLVLYGNKISKLSPGAFSGLTSLQLLWI